VVFSLAINLSGFLTAKRHPKLIILFCGVWLSAIYFASSFARTFWTWWALYVLAAGIGNGGAYLTLFKVSWGWFPDRPGLASGLILSGFGFSAIIFNNIALAIVNPENL
jgi:MFS family permease